MGGGKGVVRGACVRGYIHTQRLISNSPSPPQHTTRLDHRPRDSRTRQLTADPDRVALLLRLPHRFPLRPLALQPGDAVVFHSLTLHRSGPNASGQRRYALNITYNARDNLPNVVPETRTAGSASSSSSSAGPPPPLEQDDGAIPPLPYAVVEDDAAVAAGGTKFEAGAWGVPPIPRRIHEVLERWRDGAVDGLEPGDVEEGFETEDEEVEEWDRDPPKRRRELLFWFFDKAQETREAIAFKCKALKLRFRDESTLEAGRAKICRVVVFEPPVEKGEGEKGEEEGRGVAGQGTKRQRVDE